MRTENPVTIYRQDYQPYPFEIPHIALTFELDPTTTRVTACFEVHCREDGKASPLVLNGNDLELVSITVNHHVLSPEDYHLDDTTLTLPSLGKTATIQIVSHCQPAKNSALMGLYVSGGNFFTQCEAEGYRRITWFPDRPDVLSRYHVTLRAGAEYPVLLSNGNLLSYQSLPDGRHEAVWEDPFPKPCYLFALVAGQFACQQTHVTTKTSKRKVLLQVYSDPKSEAKTSWALESLKRALQWDEERFGLELDLDRFMIVATHDFNMGAMENKGLNIFNAAYVLADPDSATDANYEAIESVIGHEYFHNWTGNRVTCRDWFQLSLKEGLTVFRDQEFSADMRSQRQGQAAAASARAVKRIDDVMTLRAVQFPEDASPMAHPIRPESYQEIGNFYTTTIYEKGAEVIRMQHTLLGEQGFLKGLQTYFQRHDGQAVTCDDFVDAMESVYQKQHPDRDLTVFRRWYRQAGTPRVAVNIEYDPQECRCTVTLSQRCAPVGIETISPGAVKKQPFHIPFAIGLLDSTGRPMALHNHVECAEPLKTRDSSSTQGETALLELTTAQQQWVFEQIPSAPIPSLLRGFSAPVIVEYPWRTEELVLLSTHDTDPFARWEAGQELASREILTIAAQHQAGTVLTVQPEFIAAWQTLLQDTNLDASYRARILTLPTEKTLAERMAALDPRALACARDFLRAELGRQLAHDWTATFQANKTPGPYQPDPQPAGQRALKNLALIYLMAGGYGAHDALMQYRDAHNNMTDRLGALHCLVHYAEATVAAQPLQEFYEKWQSDPLVIDKWFSLQATAPSTTVATIRQLMTNPAFTLRNPNRTRALVFQFCLNNVRGFHVADGSGYDYWADQVLALDELNPEVAARLARALDNWSRFVPALRTPMQGALERLHARDHLSRNVAEIVSKTLAFASQTSSPKPEHARSKESPRGTGTRRLKRS